MNGEPIWTQKLAIYNHKGIKIHPSQVLYYFLPSFIWHKGTFRAFIGPHFGPAVHMKPMVRCSLLVSSSDCQCIHRNRRRNIRQNNKVMSLFYFGLAAWVDFESMLDAAIGANASPPWIVSFREKISACYTLQYLSPGRNVLEEAHTFYFFSLWDQPYPSPRAISTFLSSFLVFLLSVWQVNVYLEPAVQILADTKGGKVTGTTTKKL